jgi:hypothetical protein
MMPLAALTLTSCLAVSAGADRILAGDLAAAIPGLTVPAPEFPWHWLPRPEYNAFSAWPNCAAWPSVSAGKGSRTPISASSARCRRPIRRGCWRPCGNGHAASRHRHPRIRPPARAGGRDRVPGERSASGRRGRVVDRATCATRERAASRLGAGQGAGAGAARDCRGGSPRPARAITPEQVRSRNAPGIPAGLRVPCSSPAEAIGKWPAHRHPRRHGDPRGDARRTPRKWFAETP